MIETRIRNLGGVPGAAAAASSVVYAATGDQYVVVTAAADLTSSRILTAGTGLSFNNLGAANSLIVSLVTPVSVSSGGSGASSFTSFGVLTGSGTTAFGVTAAPGSGQVLVGSGVNMPPFFFKAGSDGQYLLATSGQVGGFLWVNTAAASAGGGLTWLEVTTNTAMVTKNGYIATGTSLISLSLPATAVLGDTFEIIGKGSGGWVIVQGSNQSVMFGNVHTTVGASGSLGSTNLFNSISVRCSSANIYWTAIGAQGNMSVV